jgi:hypothetical protein
MPTYDLPPKERNIGHTGIGGGAPTPRSFIERLRDDKIRMEKALKEIEDFLKLVEDKPEIENAFAEATKFLYPNG